MVYRLWWLLMAAMLAGCRGNPRQSALHPAGPAAENIAWLWWIMCGAFTAVFLLVSLLALISVFRRPGERAIPPLGTTGFIVSGGIVLPFVVVLPLYIYSLQTSAALQMPEAALTVRVTGYRWWWAVEYPEAKILTANEIHIPVGQPVRLQLESGDLIHSFWVPSLHGKRDMIPGLVNEFWIQANRPGTYRGQCAEYCGTQHANMAFVVVALPEREFADWRAQRQQPPVEPATERLARGRQIFFEAGCAKCHAVRGTPAEAQIGPDLSHLGSRQTLGAGLLPNNTGNLAGWIADAPALKPGVRMPATYLEGEQLMALVAYLESLK